MESSLLFYLWRDTTVRDKDKFIASLDGTPDIRSNMSAFKSIRSMLRRVPTLQKESVDTRLPNELPLLEYMWYSPKQLNDLEYDHDKKVWVLQFGEEQFLFDNNKSMYEQLKQHGLLNDVQRDPEKYSIVHPDATQPAKCKYFKFFGDSDDDVQGDNVEYPYTSDCESVNLSDDDLSYAPLCKRTEDPKKHIVGLDPLVLSSADYLQSKPSFFDSDKAVLVYLPYFESLEDRDEIEKLLHYYKTKATELNIKAMQKDFVVEEKVDKLYEDFFGALKEENFGIKKLIDRQNDIEEKKLKYVNMWKVWEEELNLTLERIENANYKEIQKKYHKEQARKIFFAWLQNYKESHYVPYKFLSKYLK